MSVEKSSSWKENDEFEDDSDVIEPKDQKTKTEVLGNSNEFNDEEVDSGTEDDSPMDYQPPLFNTNFYIDKDMYEDFKRGNSSKLKFLSSTSEKEDNIYIKLALTFMITLLICGVINTVISGKVQGPSPISLVISVITTFAVGKFKK